MKNYVLVLCKASTQECKRTEMSQVKGHVATGRAMKLSGGGS